MNEWGKKYKEKMEIYKKDPQYIKETYIDEFNEEVCRLMEKHNITRKQLAERMNTSSAYITKILRGNVNFTFETIAKVACALNADFRFCLYNKTRTETVVRFPYRTCEHINYDLQTPGTHKAKEWTKNIMAAESMTDQEACNET